MKEHQFSPQSTCQGGAEKDRVGPPASFRREAKSAGRKQCVTVQGTASRLVMTLCPCTSSACQVDPASQLLRQAAADWQASEGESAASCRPPLPRRHVIVLREEQALQMARHALLITSLLAHYVCRQRLPTCGYFHYTEGCHVLRASDAFPRARRLFIPGTYTILFPGAMSKGWKATQGRDEQ